METHNYGSRASGCKPLQTIPIGMRVTVPGAYSRKGKTPWEADDPSANSRGYAQTLWNRQRLSEQFLDEVREWLLGAGWALFYAGSIFGAVKIDAVKNWPSVAAWRIKPILVQVNKGGYDFGELENLSPPVDDDIPEADEKDDQ